MQAKKVKIVMISEVDATAEKAEEDPGESVETDVGWRM